METDLLRSLSGNPKVRAFSIRSPELRSRLPRAQTLSDTDNLLKHAELAAIRSTVNPDPVKIKACNGVQQSIGALYHA